MLAVFDGVGAGFDGKLDSFEALGVRCDEPTESTGLADEGAELLAGELRRTDVLARYGQRSGGHDLDEVGTVADLLANCAAEIGGPIGLSVHAAEQAAAR